MRTHFFSLLNAMVALVLIFTLAAPLTAFADDGQPGDPTPEAAEGTQAEDGSQGEEGIAGEETQPVDTVTEESALIEDVNVQAPVESTVEGPAADEVDSTESVADEPVVNEETVAQVVVALDEADAVLVSEGGEILPLTSEAAADALIAPDPIGCPAGIRPVTWGGTGAGCTASYASIQAAINDGLVAAGWTIYIDAGTYTENVQVTKSVTLQGAGQSSTIIYPAVSSPDPGCTADQHSCVNANNTVIWVLADNVSIFDLTVNGDNPALTSGVVVGGADIDARNGIFTNTNTNLTVQDVTVENVYGRGIQMSSHLGTFNFSNNTIDNVQGYSAMTGISPSAGKWSSWKSSAGIFNFTSTGTISGNTISNVVNGISNNYSTGATITGNQVSNFIDSGIQTDNNQGNTDTISGNIIRDGVGGKSYGILVRAAFEPVTVSGNQISNVDYGLTLAGTGRDPLETITFSGNTVNANVAGAYVTTDVWRAYSGDSLSNFINNTITSNHYGFYLESQGNEDTLPPPYVTFCPDGGECTLHVIAQSNIITTPTLAEGILIATGLVPWYGVDPDFNGIYIFDDLGNIWRTPGSPTTNGETVADSQRNPLWYVVKLIQGSAEYEVTALKHLGNLSVYGVQMFDISGAIQLHITAEEGLPTFEIIFKSDQPHMVHIALSDGSHFEIPTVCAPSADGADYDCSALYTPSGTNISFDPVVCLHD